MFTSLTPRDMVWLAMGLYWVHSLDGWIIHWVNHPNEYYSHANVIYIFATGSDVINEWIIQSRTKPNIIPRAMVWYVLTIVKSCFCQMPYIDITPSYRYGPRGPIMSLGVNPSTYKKAWSLHTEFGRDRTWLQAIYFTRGTEGLTPRDMAWYVLTIVKSCLCQIPYIDITTCYR